MGSSTANLAIPYPTGTDRVTDGDNAMQAMAERVDALIWRGTGLWLPLSVSVGTPVGAGYRDPTYTRDGRWVHVRGNLGGYGGGLSAGATVFTLPLGYRPTQQETFVIRGGTTAAAVIAFNILTTGEGKLDSALGAGGNISLAGLRFAVD
jgi:hypothetical protein